MESPSLNRNDLVDLMYYYLNRDRLSKDKFKDNVLERFLETYRQSTIPKYVSFAAVGDGGIPRLIEIFLRFDPVNTKDVHPKFLSYRPLRVNNVHHIMRYLKAPEFNRDLLRSKKHDSVVQAIISYILQFDSSIYTTLSDMHPEFSRLMLDISFERHRDDGAHVYCYQNDIPYIKTAMKSIRRQFEPESDLDLHMQPKRAFQLLDHLDYDFTLHLRAMYMKLQKESLTAHDTKQLEQDLPIPHNLEASVGSYEGIRKRARVKFITGQACCGKTTLLNSLRRVGWKIVSRGTIGSFSGKADNPVAVACLHASIEWALSHSDVLGDRGNIDNPLWVGIMEMCDPRYKETLVTQMLRFMNSNFNEPLIAYFMGQKGVVFIDPYPSLCAQRMLQRSTDGDPYRGRLSTYAITQAMFYYTIARLFGWKIYCVPYTEHRVFDPSAYKNITDELLTRFGFPDQSNPLPQAAYDKPPNNYEVNNVFPKSVGIYK